MHRSSNTNESGFSLLQIVITMGFVAVLASMGVLGITRTRSHMRLSSSTRQFAAYVERARADAVRRHGQTSIEIASTSMYNVSMDYGVNGTVTTQSFSLETNVHFITQLQTITFDWRGRVSKEVSVGFQNEVGTANVNITGSGDVTIDSEIFHDASVPKATYNENVNGDLMVDPTPIPAATPASSPSPSPSPEGSPSSSPSPTPTPDATPTPHPGHDPNPKPTPTATATPTPTPTPTPTQTPTPTPQPCTILATPSPLVITQNGSGILTVAVVGANGSTTIVATPSNHGQIQVDPEYRTLNGASPGTFVVTVKKQSGSITLESSCGSKTVTVTVPE